MHKAPLEFHHREDLPRPPYLVATVLSRSTFDLTEVSLSPLPVIAFIEFAFQCLSPEDLIGVRSFSSFITNNKRNVSDVLILTFQGSKMGSKKYPSYIQPHSEPYLNPKSKNFIVLILFVIFLI